MIKGVTMIYTTIKLPQPLLNELKAMADASYRSVPKQIAWLLNEYKKRTETAQEYCEREPLYSELLAAKRDIGTKQGYKVYTSTKDLFDDIP